ARMPRRSSPTSPNPVTSHPDGSGQGSHTGTSEVFRSASTAISDGCRGGWYGRTSPCASQRQALDHTLGACSGPKHRGQVGAALTATHGASSGTTPSRPQPVVAS